MEKIKIISAYTFILLCICFVATSCSKDDGEENADYIGSWYREQLNSSASEMTIIVANVGKNAFELVMYEVTGRNLNQSTGIVTNVKKTTERYSFSVSNKIVTIMFGEGTESYKYSIIDNQLILTSTQTGTIYGLFKVTSDVKPMIDYLEKISI